MKTYIINLKDSVKRRETVLAATKEYPTMDIELVEAVNGKSMSEEEQRERFDHKRFTARMGMKVMPGEIGCTLSHRECCRRLLTSNEEFALILEDDVCFLDPESVEPLLQQLSEKMAVNIPCIITLTRHRIYYKHCKGKIGKYSLYRIREAWGTCAYLINRKAAAKILSITKPYYVADDFLLMNQLGILVLGIYPMLANGASEMAIIDSDIIERDSPVRIPSRFNIHYFTCGIFRILLLKLHILERRSYK
ncbi:glycosyltransferase family 25 protein [uncultured Parabacteroides sp.]|uniref:glycosyltransferase family 25 protein n=1 Tax=uncultured Parabacteroides sp. TaxID=512312 RepID=UPI00259BC2BA|nr:glycosyltransferase family 25 protein [uncultured Parabacteroides sp.]